MPVAVSSAAAVTTFAAEIGFGKLRPGICRQQIRHRLGFGRSGQNRTSGAGEQIPEKGATMHVFTPNLCDANCRFRRANDQRRVGFQPEVSGTPA